MQLTRCALLILLVSTLASHAQPAPGTQVEMRLEAPGGGAIPYLLYFPTNYQAKGNTWPLLLFLHGRGESDGPLSLVKKWGPPRLIERGENFPYVVASPQCPRSESWGQPGQQALLVALLDHLEKSYNIDRDRVYLTGLSMGGYGSWRLAADHPERFAAVVPICGGGKPEDASRLTTLPIWVWHGTEDGAVPLKSSVEMVEAIQAAGGKTIKFTTLEGIGHNSWEAAYATPEIYQWMDQQSVSKNRLRNPAVGSISGGTSKFASMDGTKIHYVRAGAGAPTLVFVHGWASHTGFWHEQVSALADKASLIFIDLPGHGLSDKTQTEYTMDYFARAVLAVLKDAGVDKAVLVGHSMGVPVICRAFAQAPDKVAGLVAVDGTFRKPTLRPDQIERIVGGYRTPEYQEQATRFIQKMFPAGAETLRDQVVSDIVATPQHVMSSAMEQMFNPDQPAWDLPKLDVPVIALLAPNAMWNSAYEEYVKSLSAKADYRIIPGCGHFLMLEKPAEFNAALVDMLEKAGLLSK